VLESLREEYRKLFQSDIDMRDQDNIVKDQLKVEEETKTKEIDMEVDVNNVEVEIRDNEESDRQGEGDDERPSESIEKTEVRQDDAESPKSVILNSGDVDMQGMSKFRSNFIDEETKVEPKSAKLPREAQEHLNLTSEDMNIDITPATNSSRPHSPQDPTSIDSYLWKMLIEMSLEVVDATEQRRELMGVLEERKKQWAKRGQVKGRARGKGNRKIWKVGTKYVSVKDSLEKVFQNFENAKNQNHKSFTTIFEEESKLVNPKKSSLDSDIIDEVMVPLNLAIFQ